MKIEISELLFEPKVDGRKINILGEEYLQIIKDPNLFVIKTNFDLIEGSDIEFSFNENLYILNKITSKLVDGNVFVECRYWQNIQKIKNYYV